jgi:hypothetical protein
VEGEGHDWVSKICEKKTAVENSYMLWAADSCELKEWVEVVQGEEADCSIYSCWLHVV